MMFLGILKTNDVKWCVAIGVLMMTAYSLSPDWQEWLMDSTLGLWLSRLKQIIETHSLLNVLVVSLTVGVTYVICKRWYQDIDNRWYRPLCALMGLQLMWVQNPLETVEIIGRFDYRLLCTLSLVAMTVLLMWRFTKNVNSAKAMYDNKVESHGTMFAVDKIDPSKLSDSMKKYGNSIIKHLLGTRLDGESFAIGVTGAWGSGKTTFMKYLEERLEDKAEVVWFNPWMCRTPEQVTEDYFVTLHHTLSRKHSTLSYSIRDYAKYINTVTSSWGSDFLTMLTSAIPQESLMDRKNRLAERFSELGKPVVVFIDDLDRLECDEMFEVLRLIRNTADLSNVFYVVTFDKEYVTTVIGEKGIKDADGYLDKIFPIEIHLPQIENAQLYQALYIELSKNPKYKEMLPRSLFSLINQKEREMLIDILNTYRSVIRFARLFLLNFDYLQDAYRQEIKMLDLFWLELLQEYDRRTYYILANQRDLLLNTTGTVYSLRDNINKISVSSDEEICAYEGEMFRKPLTQKILKLLFEDRRNVSQFSMRYAENYDKYFTLSVSEKRLSFKEYQKLFDASRDSLKVVAEWVDGHKYFSSILYHFEHTSTGTLPPEGLGRYIMGLLELAYQTVQWDDKMTYRIKDMLRYPKYWEKQRSWGAGYMLGWFNEKICLNKDLKIVSLMLKRLYISIEVNKNGSSTTADNLFISNDDVIMLLRDIMKKYLQSNPEISALDVISKNKEAGIIFKNCTVCHYYNFQIEVDSEYENVAFDIVIKHFEGKPKPSFEQFDRAIEELFKIEEPEGLSPMDYDEYLNSTESDADMQRTLFWGSDWTKVNEFKERCFVENL